MSFLFFYVNDKEQEFPPPPVEEKERTSTFAVCQDYLSIILLQIISPTNFGSTCERTYGYMWHNHKGKVVACECSSSFISFSSNCLSILSLIMQLCCLFFDLFSKEVKAQAKPSPKFGPFPS